MIDLRSPLARGALLLLVASLVIPSLCMAQATPAGSSAPTDSRFEIFGGYGYFHPIGSDIYNQIYDPIPGGFVGSFTGYFNHSFGLQAEYAKFPNSPDYCMSTIQGGPVIRHPIGRLIPFARVIGGAAQIGPSYGHTSSSIQCDWGWAATGGVGVDYVLPTAALRNHLAIRPIQADFHFSRVNYGPQNPPTSFTGGFGQITAFRLSTGLVYRFGATEPSLPAAFGCEAQPVTVFPGDPITITGRVINLEENKKRLPVYTWETTGGRISGIDGGATINTSGVAPGDYTVIGHVREGSGPAQHADCTATFRVVAYQPPSVTCSANPSSVQPGGLVSISVEATSPQNRPLSYSFGTTAGQIASKGSTATLTTADVRPGPVTVTCNVVDDRGNANSDTATVVVVKPPPPPPPPAPEVRQLCSVSFERDRRRPVRVDNEAKACLDDVALELTRESSATLVLVGKHGPDESPEAAAERTLNVKQYLTDEKGIDPGRIQVRTGETRNRSVDDILVPQGATWDPAGTTSFDPGRVQRHGEPYAPGPHR